LALFAELRPLLWHCNVPHKLSDVWCCNSTAGDSLHFAGIRNSHLISMGYAALKFGFQSASLPFQMLSPSIEMLALPAIIMRR
jgi:hypothetical protein